MGDAPSPHIVETHEGLPEKMLYAMNSAQYGDIPTQTNRDYKSRKDKFHTSPIRKYEDWLDELLFKGISDLPDQPLVNSSNEENVYEASKFLSKKHRASGYAMRVRSSEHSNYGPWITVEIFHENKPVGGSSASIKDHRYINGKLSRELSIDFSDIRDDIHRGKGLGLSMYEAMLAHAKNVFAATHVIGGIHSTMAHQVHQKLANKYGLKYRAEPNILLGGMYPNEKTWREAAIRPGDARFGPYRYTIEPSEDK